MAVYHWFASGLTTPSGWCDAGFYCPGGDDVPNPIETPCPIGLHCPLGSSLPVPCEPGYYTNLTQAAECLICPPGHYCVPEEVVEGEARRKNIIYTNNFVWYLQF